MIALEQQVNLFQPIFRAERKLFSTPFIAGSLAATVVVLALLWGFAWRQVVALEREVTAVAAARDQRSDAIRRVGAGLASDPAAIAARARDLAAGIERAERTLALIRNGAVGSTTGFSARMRAIARPEESGLWLTRVAFSGRDVAFAGVALEAASIPRYLQAIAADGAFAALRVDSLRAARQENDAGRIGFVAGNVDLLDADRGDKDAARPGVKR